MLIQKKIKSASLKGIMSYSPPKLHTGKEWYVGFMAFDPAKNDMRRKKIKLNFIEKIGERRKYADGLIKRLNVQLESGWNPWIEKEHGKAYNLFDEVCKSYSDYIQKLHADGIFREDTYKSYISYLDNLKKFNKTSEHKITYIYQFDDEYIDVFLNHVYIERDNTPQTRNNYLGWISTFGNYLLQHHYVKVKPGDSIKMISKKKIKKQRKVISDPDMSILSEFLYNKNKYYLLGCYLLHYCFIRPKEMSLLRIADISVTNQTIYINDDVSKNRNSAVVTIPSKVMKLLIELDLFKFPSHFYIFSKAFEPGAEYKNDKQFRDYWARVVRKDLKFPKTYKFYSLKDTGITNMLRLMDKISVRDQARHSSLLTTDIYTPHDLQEANDLIKHHTGAF